MKRLTYLHPMFAPESAASTGVTDPAAGDTELDLDNLPDTHMVPVSVVKKIREDGKLTKAELQQLRDSHAQLSDTLTIYRMQLQQGMAGNGGQAQKSQEPEVIEGDDDEPLTVGQAKKILAHANAKSSEVAAVSRLTSQPDFQDVINNHLPNVLKADPSLAAELKAIPNEAARYAMAYRMGKTDPAYLAKKIKAGDTTHPDAKKIEENLKKPGSVAGITGGSVSSTEADRIKGMSSEEFRKYRAEVQARGRG